MGHYRGNTAQHLPHHHLSPNHHHHHHHGLCSLLMFALNSPDNGPRGVAVEKRHFLLAFSWGHSLGEGEKTKLCRCRLDVALLLWNMHHFISFTKGVAALFLWMENCEQKWGIRFPKNAFQLGEIVENKTSLKYICQLVLQKPIQNIIHSQLYYFHTNRFISPSVYFQHL